MKSEWGFESAMRWRCGRERGFVHVLRACSWSVLLYGSLPLCPRIPSLCPRPFVSLHFPPLLPSQTTAWTARKRSLPSAPMAKCAATCRPMTSSRYSRLADERGKNKLHHQFFAQYPMTLYHVCKASLQKYICFTHPYFSLLINQYLAALSAFLIAACLVGRRGRRAAVGRFGRAQGAAVGRDARAGMQGMGGENEQRLDGGGKYSCVVGDRYSGKLEDVAWVVFTLKLFFFMFFYSN
jgi:hypothetical protein